MSQNDANQHQSNLPDTNLTTLRALAHLCRQIGGFQPKPMEDRLNFLESLGLSNEVVTRVIDVMRLQDEFQGAKKLLNFHWHVSADCGIGWGPSVMAPVFYGIQHFDTTDEAPCPMRVFYPSIDGAVQDAPFLGCGHYPLIIFLHGHCTSQGLDNYLKWYLLPAQLARSGYVVVVPQLPDIAFGGSPWDSSDLQLAKDVVYWMQNQWLYRDYLLMRPPVIGVAGHSYGALLGARLVSEIDAKAYVSLSGVWLDWPSNPPRPINNLDVPSLFMWGSSSHFNEIQAVLEGNAAGIWNAVPAPKHRVVFEDGDHWDYLPSSQISCGQFPGSCNLIKSLATG